MRTFDGPARAGLNRATWDLRHDGPSQVELRTIPPDNPHIWEEARFKGRDTRPIVHWGIQNPQRFGPLAVPGRYSVRLAVGGTTLTRPFEVLGNPKMAAPASDLSASLAAQVRIRDDINRSVTMINRLEVMRKQIEDRLKAAAGRKPAEQALRDLDAKMMKVELQLLSRTDLHSDDKWYVEAYKVYMNLVWLSGVVGTGAGTWPGAPTAGRPTPRCRCWRRSRRTSRLPRQTTRPWWNGSFPRSTRRTRNWRSRYNGGRRLCRRAWIGATSGRLAPIPDPRSLPYLATAWTCTAILTSSPTRKPPVSSAAFHVRP